jgi:hypothetical protein
MIAAIKVRVVRLCKGPSARGKKKIDPMEVGNPFLEFSSDILQSFFAEQNPLQLRLICRSMREKVENYPDFDLHLSLQGTQSASSTFFTRFKGKISVGSRHGWDPLRGWFPSLIDAIRRGVRVDTIFSIVVNSLNLMPFSAKLNEACHEKVQRLSISLTCTRKSLASSIAALTAVCQVAERVDLKLNILFRRPRELLLDVVDKIKVLHGAISLISLTIWYITCDGFTITTLIFSRTICIICPHFYFLFMRC